MLNSIKIHDTESMTAMEKMCLLMGSSPDKAYDHVANHWSELSKNELADIVKELLYSLYSAQRRRDIMPDDYRMILEDAAEELGDAYQIEFLSDEE